jgi:hypothetical protein
MQEAVEEVVTPLVLSVLAVLVEVVLAVQEQAVQELLVQMELLILVAVAVDWGMEVLVVIKQALEALALSSSATQAHLLMLQA